MLTLWVRVDPRAMAIKGVLCIFQSTSITEALPSGPGYDTKQSGGETSDPEYIPWRCKLHRLYLCRGVRLLQRVSDTTLNSLVGHKGTHHV